MEPDTIVGIIELKNDWLNASLRPKILVDRVTNEEYQLSLSEGSTLKIKRLRPDAPYFSDSSYLRLLKRETN